MQEENIKKVDSAIYIVLEKIVERSKVSDIYTYYLDDGEINVKTEYKSISQMVEDVRALIELKETFKNS